MRNCAIIIMILMLSGCGMRAPGYAHAQQLPPIDFPPNSLPVSHRYDIPRVTSSQNCIIDEVKPPYY